jgi:hypothetical protein
MSGAPEGAGAASGSSTRRPIPWARVTLQALAVVSVALVFILLLDMVAVSDRAGRSVLGGLSGLIHLLTGTGALIQDTIGRQLPTLRWLLLVAAAAGVFSLVRYRRGRSKRELPVLLGILLLVLSATFLLSSPLFALFFGVAGASGLLLIPARESDGSPWSVVWLAVPFGLGMLLRFYALEAMPEGYAEHAVVHHVSLSLPYKDALFSLLQAGKLREAAGTAWGWIVREHFGLMSLLAAIGFKTVGVSLTISRALSATTGTLAVLCAYFCGKNLFDRRVGLVFSFLLAICPWHIVGSRYGDLEHVLSPFQFLLAVALYAAAFRRGRTLDWILAGGALGLSWFVYASNQILPAIVGLHLLLMLVFRRGFFRSSWWKVLLFSAVFASLSFSTLAMIARDGILKPNTRTGYQEQEVIPAGQFERNVQMTRETVSQLFVKVTDPWFAKPGGGLSLTEATLLLPGILLCLAGLFVPELRWPSALVLIGLPLSLLPGILGPDPTFRRVFLTATLASLLAAVVLLRAADALRALGIPPAVVKGAGAALAVVLALVNAHVYFNVASYAEEDTNRYYTAMAGEVRKVLGKEFVYVYMPSALPPDDHHRYIRLAAYERLAELWAKGSRAEDLYAVVAGRALLDSLKDPRRISGRFRILAEAGLVKNYDDGINLREAIRNGFPGAREEELLDSRRDPLVRTWRLP